MRRIASVLVSTVLALAACGGGQEADPIAEPEVLAGGEAIYSGSCRSCHGAAGAGGAGPALTATAQVFAGCDEEVRWIMLGSSRWREEVGSTYADTAKPVEGGMPGYSGRLSDEEIRLVTAWTRWRFSGEGADTAAEACGVEGG